METTKTAPLFETGPYSLNISAEGLTHLLKNRSEDEPARNVVWTTDPRVELPVLVAKTGVASVPPMTVFDMWRKQLARGASNNALNDKINGKWVTLTYQQYYDRACKFAMALIKSGVTPRSAVSILGYNCSEWFIDFFGAVFANCIGCGHYLTNGPDAVAYVVDHSDSEIFVAENQEQLNKVLQVWDSLPRLKKIVVWRPFTLDAKYQSYASRVVSHADFMNFEVTPALQAELDARMAVQRPGHAISYVYTSGTTGNPKGVMLSHDNYAWTANAVGDSLLDEYIATGKEIRGVSYLPLSHVAGQYADLILSLSYGANVYFTDSNALKGTLVNYLTEVKPVFFVGVPRVYEKMEEKVVAELEKKPLIYKWARHYGRLGTDAQMKGQEPPLGFKIFEKLVLNKVKAKLGLDKSVLTISGAAPISYKTRQFFFDMNIFVNNTFGMSETSAPHSTLLRPQYQYYDLRSAGITLDGCQTIVEKSDPKAEEGELCFRGRHIFLGYLKNETATKETIDNQRRVHSGDEGKVNKDGVVYITGRLKELLVTAGGENIAPVPIELNIKEELPFLSNVMVIGDQKKFVSALMTLRVTSTPAEKPNYDLQPEALAELEKVGIKGVKTVQEAIASKELAKAIQAGIDRANKKAVSNAAKVKAWFIVADDFTIPGGEFTPTLKVRRKEVVKKYNEKILDVYSRPDL
jgi:long-chain-fatty-acid--CoA ligase ACSBG